MNLRNSSFFAFGLILLYGILFFVPFLGQVHLFDWDEINFAESAREMILSKDYLTVQINFQPFWEKPPLFIWLQVLSMKIFGINEFAARFPNAICGIVSLWVLFNTGRRLYDVKFGLYWVLAYAGSFLPFFYFKSGIIDPWFNLFIFIGIIHFVHHQTTSEGSLRHLAVSAFFIGLAVLTKGPAAIIIFLLSFAVYFIFRRFKIKASFRDVMIYFFIVLITGGSWYLLIILKGNYDLIKEFILYQFRLLTTEDAGHGGFFMYHFFVLLIGVFPASFVALPSFRDQFDGPGLRKDFFLFMMILFWVVLILFSLVNTKIVHYSSLCYFPLTYFAALTIRKFENGERRVPLILKSFTGIIGGLFGLAVAILPLIWKYKDKLIAVISKNDLFAASNLKAEVNWPWALTFIGLIYIIALILCLYSINNNRRGGLKRLFIISSIFIYVVITIVVPRIEAVTQRAAVEFYKDISTEDAYITTLGFKSYAHLFYGNVQETNALKAAPSAGLLEKDCEQTCYFVFKIDRKEKYMIDYPFLEIIYEKNGFVFAKKKI